MRTLLKDVSQSLIRKRTLSAPLRPSLRPGLPVTGYQQVNGEDEGLREDLEASGDLSASVQPDWPVLGCRFVFYRVIRIFRI
jgi:hypothetical protein